MILLRLITWPYVRKHLVRSLLTIAGIVLGVTVFVGMHTANQSVLFAFYRDRRSDRRRDAASDHRGRAWVSGGGSREECRALPEVRVAVPVIEAVVQHAIRGRRVSLLILAVDMTGDRSLREYDLESGEEAIIEDPLVFLAQPDSLIVTEHIREAARAAGRTARFRSTRWKDRSSSPFGASCGPAD